MARNATEQIFDEMKKAINEASLKERRAGAGWDGLRSRSTRARVEAMTLRGDVPREISAKLNISTQAVYEHLRNIGIPPAKRK